MGRTEADRQITNEPWSSMQRVKRANKTTHKSEWRVALKKDLTEPTLLEMSGYGVVCFISNYSWLDGLSFTGMRESYLDKFDRIWIDCLNCDKYKTCKLTPEGKPDPSIFSTEWNREGIQVGTAIGLLSRRLDNKESEHVEFRTFGGKNNRDDLIKSLDNPTNTTDEPNP